MVTGTPIKAVFDCQPVGPPLLLGAGFEWGKDFPRKDFLGMLPEEVGDKPDDDGGKDYKKYTKNQVQ